MNVENKILKAEKLLEENKQDSVLRILRKLDSEKKEKLAEQILQLDFEQLRKLYKETQETPEILEKKLEHINYVDKYKISDEKRNTYLNLGEEIIKNGKYAVVTMAGGQ